MWLIFLCNKVMRPWTELLYNSYMAVSNVGASMLMYSPWLTINSPPTPAPDMQFWSWPCPVTSLWGKVHLKNIGRETIRVVSLGWIGVGIRFHIIILLHFSFFGVRGLEGSLLLSAALFAEGALTEHYASVQ